MDHMCTALTGSGCSVCEQRQRDHELFNENSQLKVTLTQVLAQNDKLICDLVEVAARLGVPSNQVGYDNTMLRIHAFQKLLEAARIYVATGDSDLIVRALIPFANDPA